MIPAGRRTERVIFQAKVAAARDTVGQRVDAGWETYATRWAEVVALSGRELEQARQMIGTATHRITVPLAGLGGMTVRPQHRILWGSAELEIGSALPARGLKEELVVIATLRTD